jgi:hypothetical protein
MEDKERRNTAARVKTSDTIILGAAGIRYSTTQYKMDEINST